MGRPPTNNHEDAEEAANLQEGTRSPDKLRRPSGALGWLWKAEEADEQRRRLKNRDDEETNEQQHIKNGEEDTEQATDRQDGTSLLGKLRHGRPSGALGWLWRDADEQQRRLKSREQDTERIIDLPDTSVPSVPSNKRDRPSGALGWLWRDADKQQRLKNKEKGGEK
jgi:hypothetical protein